jgi:hypothetical protein
VGVAIYDLFDQTCSGLDECASEAVNEYALEDDEVVDSLTTVINDAIEVPAALDGGLSHDGYRLDYGVSLDALDTYVSTDHLETTWEVTLESGAADDPCAAGLTLPWSFGNPGHTPATTNDLELEAPLALISRAIVLAGKQGALCASTSSIMGTFGTASVVPDGSPRLTVLDASSALVEIVLPMSGTITGTTSGTVELEAHLQAHLEVDCDQGLWLVIDSAGADITGGALSLFGMAVDPLTLEPVLDSLVASSLPAAMPQVQLIPAVTDLGDLDLGLAVGRIAVRNNHLVVGFDLDDACSSGGGGGGGGGVYIPGDFDPYPWDDEDGDPGTLDGDPLEPGEVLGM